MFVYTVLIFLSCRDQVKDDSPRPGMTPAGMGKSAELMRILEGINNNTPETIAATMTVESSVKEKKMKILGTALYDRKSVRMSLAFTDFVFKSPITNIYRDGNEIWIYTPAEKKLFIESYSTFDLNSYTGIDAEFRYIYALATFSIPLIEFFKVKNVYVSDKGSSALILENRVSFETISFANGLPDRILFVNKSGGERLEIILNYPERRGTALYYRNIGVIAKNGEARLAVTFDYITLNAPVAVPSLKEIKLRLPADTQILGR